MKKEEVLEKSKNENLFFDEREDQELGTSFGYGAIVVCILCVFFSIINVIKGKTFYEFGAILFAYIAAVALRTYFITQRKKFLAQAVVNILAFIFALVRFILVG